MIFHREFSTVCHSCEGARNVAVDDGCWCFMFSLFFAIRVQKHIVGILYEQQTNRFRFAYNSAYCHA